jgi:hypothetical protein
MAIVNRPTALALAQIEKADADLFRGLKHCGLPRAARPLCADLFYSAIDLKRPSLLIPTKPAGDSDLKPAAVPT